MARKSLGDQIEPRLLDSIQGAQLSIPPAANVMHLQFRRFAGCPICNRHLQSFIRRHDELLASGIQEVVVFHSPKSDLLAHLADAPFACIADPERKLYREFGVESSIMSVLNPGAWGSAVKGVFRHGAGLPSRGESALGLPADLLIDHRANVVALKYGKHAADHWEVDDLLQMVREPR